MENTEVLKANVSISEAGDVEGIAWVFGQPDSIGDMIAGPVTFAKTVAMVREHDQEKVVGHWSDFAAFGSKSTKDSEPSRRAG